MEKQTISNQNFPSPHYEYPHFHSKPPIHSSNSMSMFLFYQCKSHAPLPSSNMKPTAWPNCLLSTFASQKMLKLKWPQEEDLQELPLRSRLLIALWIAEFGRYLYLNSSREELYLWRQSRSSTLQTEIFLRKNQSKWFFMSNPKAFPPKEFSSPLLTQLITN